MTLLETRKEEIVIFNQYSAILVDFCDLGVSSPETEVDLIYLTLNQFSPNQWVELSAFEKKNDLKSHQTTP